MKRIAVVLLVLVLVMGMTGCIPVLLSSKASGTVIYDRYGISFAEELTEEEVKAVATVLHGKRVDPSFMGKPSCGFDYNVAIIIGGRRFGLALDGCGTVVNYSSLGYIHISAEEQDVLEEIFTSRGGEFPCI